MVNNPRSNLKDNTSSRQESKAAQTQGGRTYAGSRKTMDARWSPGGLGSWIQERNEQDDGGKLGLVILG